MTPCTFHPPLSADTWQPDYLGHDLQARALPLPANSQGESVATLIRHAPPHREAPEFAALYVHGWSDYFFNREMAEFFTANGGAFYAVDMHASGRSLCAHQIPGYVPDLREYFPDLDAAARHIRSAHPHLPLIVVAHSQGALTAALWARGNPVSGLIFNSPWLDQPYTSFLRWLLTPLVIMLARWWPETPVPIPSPRFYERTISRALGGEWPIRDEWRPDVRSPSRPGWMHASLRAQHEVARRVNLTMPILVLTSHASLIQPMWDEDMWQRDVITDVNQTWRRSRDLGRNLRLVKIRDAVHDVLLSAPKVRAHAYREIQAWLTEQGLPPPHSAEAPRG